MKMVRIYRWAEDTVNGEIIISQERVTYLRADKSSWTIGKFEPTKFVNPAHREFIETSEVGLKEALEESPLSFHEFFQKYLKSGKKDEVSGFWKIQELSYQPDKGTPWKRFGRRTYLWLLPTGIYPDTGRRIVSSRSIKYYASRKEALEALYKD